MRGSAVGFDDGLLVAPEEVDLDLFDPRVHFGAGQLRIEDEGEEPLLELGAGDVRLSYLQPFDGFCDRPRASPFGSGQLLIEGMHVEEAEVLGSVDEALGLVRRERGGDVDEGAGDGGDRQPIALGHVSLLQPSVDSDPRRRPGAREGADVELRW